MRILAVGPSSDPWGDIGVTLAIFAVLLIVGVIWWAISSIGQGAKRVLGVAEPKAPKETREQRAARIEEYEKQQAEVAARVKAASEGSGIDAAMEALTKAERALEYHDSLDPDDDALLAHLDKRDDLAHRVQLADDKFEDAIAERNRLLWAAREKDAARRSESE